MLSWAPQLLLPFHFQLFEKEEPSGTPTSTHSSESLDTPDTHGGINQDNITFDFCQPEDSVTPLKVG